MKEPAALSHDGPDLPSQHTTTITMKDDRAAGAASRCYLSRVSGLYRHGTCPWCAYPLEDLLTAVSEYAEARDAKGRDWR